MSLDKPLSSTSLDEIGVIFSSDASSLAHNYLKSYEQILKISRDTQSEIMIIGAGTPGNIFTWRDYYPRAKFIIAEQRSEALDLADQRTEIVVPKYYDFSLFNNLSSKYSPLLIIDDGSHRWDHQKIAFNTLFSALRPGGYYIVEDLHTNFGDLSEKYDGGENQSFYQCFEEIMSGMASGDLNRITNSGIHEDMYNMIASITVLKKAIIIHKCDDVPYSYKVSSISSLTENHILLETSSYKRLPAYLGNANLYIKNTFDKLSDKSQEVSIGNVVSGTLSDVTIMGGGMVFAQDKVVSESLNCIRNLSEYRGFRRNIEGSSWSGEYINPRMVIKVIAGRQHVLLKSAWDANYGHWLWDTLTKIHVYKKSNSRLKPIWVINKPSKTMRDVVYESLSLAGICSEDIMELDFQSYQFESLFVPGSLTEHPTIKAPEAVRYLERIAEKIEPASYERVYLTRNSYGRRELLNEDQIWPFFQEKEFIKITPEKLSLNEQISIFRGAKVIAGNMGAGFSSLAFSPSGVEVISLATPAMPHDFFYDIVCHKNGSYFGLQGATSDKTPSMSSNFTIDVETLKAILQKF